MPTLEQVYDEREEQARLLVILDPRYLRTLAATHEVVAAALPELTMADFRVDDAATRALLAEAAQQVVLIDETTRSAIREVLQEGQRLGLSNWELAHGSAAAGFVGIEQLFTVTWASRAETVARTELANAQNVSALDRYAATGLVSQVEIVEHEDTDAECAARNGQRVPLSEKPGLLHPNCRMAVIPIVDEAA